jgi:hypothetical protein
MPCICEKNPVTAKYEVFPTWEGLRQDIHVKPEEIFVASTVAIYNVRRQYDGFLYMNGLDRDVRVSPCAPGGLRYAEAVAPYK